MNVRILLALCWLAFYTAPSGADAAPGAGKADFLLINARIYTEQHWAPWAHALAVAGERIIYVGEPHGAEWDALIGPKTRAYDLHNRLVLPGIIDSHTHPGLVTLSAWHTILPWTMNPDEQLGYLKKWAAEHPDRPIIDAELYPTQMFGAAGPTRQLIDRYIPDRAVIWEDFSGHSVALNSRALALMGIDKHTPDPVPGTSLFVRDANGNPTGWAKEDPYSVYLPKLFKAVNWSPPTTVTAQTFGKTLDFLSAHGVTAVFDGFSSEDEFQALATLEHARALHLYYEGSLRFETLAELPAKIAVIRDWQHRYGSKHVRINTLKLFLDGTNELSTSALLEPFANNPNNSGAPVLNKVDLVESLLLLNRENMDIHIHMTGDRSFRLALDAVEEARKQLGSQWRMQVTFAHCELISDQDMPRVAPLGVLINWTPHWSGGYFQGPQETLGMQRYDNMYRFQPIIASGGIVTFGSDTTTLYEWSRADPFIGMQIAHTRFDVEPRYQAYGVRKPLSEMLQLPDLVRGYTINGAIQLRRAADMGSIETGKLANIVVLNQDLFEVQADKIQFTAPTAVIFEGQIVQGSLQARPGH